MQKSRHRRDFFIAPSPRPECFYFVTPVPGLHPFVTPRARCRHPGAGRDPLRRRHFLCHPAARVFLFCHPAARAPRKRQFSWVDADRGAHVIRSRRAATQIAVVCADAQDSTHLDPGVKPRDDIEWGPLSGQATG